MWSTLPYLVKVQICFALLWIVYRFFLQRDGRFARSRAYLLLSVPVSFLIPLLSIPVLPASQPAPVPAVPVAAVAEAPVRAQPVSAAEDASLFAEAAPAALSASPVPSPASGAAPAMTVASPGAQASAFFREAAASAFAALVPAGWSGLMYAWLLWCGIAGSLLLLLYYLGHTLRWVRLMREGNVSRMLDDVRVVYSPAVSSPCSLFNCIFINRRDLGENEFRELMAHELCHIRLRHSWDRLLAVVVTLFCWWNPFVWLWHRSLCEVHEYQADDAVLQCGFDAEQYIMLMVSSVAGARTTLASGFSYSLVRKRLQMLSRGASRRAGLRMLLVVPALAVLCCSRSSRSPSGRSQPAARNKFLPNSPTNCFPRSVIPPMRFRPPCRPKRPRRKGRYSFPGTIPSRRMIPNRPLRYSPVRLSRTHPVFPDTVLRFRGSLLPYSASRQRAMMS